MGSMIYRLLLNSTSLATLIAIATPIGVPFVALTFAPEAAAATTVTPDASSPQLANLPTDALKDDHGDDDDDYDDDDYDDDDHDDDDGMRRTETRTRTTTTTVTQVTYTDVSTNYWASEFIYRLASINVVTGFPEGQFAPNEYLTKAQYAAIVTKAFNRTAVRETVTIRNVSQYYWAYSALQQAYSTGFINLGPNNTFDPEVRITKLDMLVMLAQALGYTEVTSGKSVDTLLSVFVDADTIPSEYRVIIAALVEKGIIVNYPNVNRLNLYEAVTRAEGCTFIYQAMASMNLVETVYSAYIVDVFGVFQQTETTTTETTTDVIVDDDDDDDNDDDRKKPACNQGIGNGAEGCDPGNSRPHGGSNDEGGRTPGNPNR